MSPVRTRRSRIGLTSSLAAGAAAVAVVAGACGGGGGDGAGAQNAALFVPSDAPFFVEVSTDFQGTQWQQAEALLSRFPSAPEEGIEDALTQAFDDEGVDYETQVRPLLGDKAVVAATPQNIPTSLNISASDTADDSNVIAVLQLADGAEDDALTLLKDEANVTETGEHEGVTLYQSSDGDTFVAVTDGALLLANSEETLSSSIDARRAGGDAALGGSEKFTNAVDQLPGDTFGKVFIDLGELAQGAADANAGAVPGVSSADLSGVALAASVATEDDGVRLQGIIEGAPDAAPATPFSPTLLQNAPADAIAYVGFANLASSVSDVAQMLREGDDPDVAQQLDAITGQLPSLLGISVDDLGALTTGEHAVIVTDMPAGSPAAALALQTDDGARATTTLDALRQATPALVAQAGGGLNSDWRPASLANGVDGWQLEVSPDASIVYGVDGNLAIVGTSPQVVREVQDPGQTLADDPGFQAATEGMPDEVTTLLWLDVPELLTAVEAADGFGPDDQEAIDNLEKVDGIAAWGTPGEAAGFEVFVRITE